MKAAVTLCPQGRHMLKIRFSIFSFILLISTGSIFADDYHNINGFAGARASAMAGAYTALSDDPSGIYYNPAGIHEASDQYSLSANSYLKSSKTYYNVYGPGEDYNLNAESTIPNYFGLVKHYGSLHAGFMMAEPDYESVDQGDIIDSPTYYSDKYKYLQRETILDKSRTLVGPAFSFAPGKSFSIGAGLFAMQDTHRMTQRDTIRYDDNTDYTASFEDRRENIMIIPTVGFKMQLGGFKLGISYKKDIQYSRERRLSGVFVFVDQGEMNVFEGNEYASTTLLDNGSRIIETGVQAGLPETSEARLGMAYEFSDSFLLSVDLIHHSGYSKNKPRYSVLVDPKRERDPEYFYMGVTETGLLERRPTLNGALGLEWKVTDSFILRAGIYTNRSNNRDLLINEVAANVVANDRVNDCDQVKTHINVCDSEAYDPYYEDTRYEYSNNVGTTLGFSIDLGDSSKFAIALNMERGSGNSQVIRNEPTQRMSFEKISLMYMTTSASENVDTGDRTGGGFL